MYNIKHLRRPLCAALVLLFAFCFLCPLPASAAHKDYSSNELKSVMQDIINWKKKEEGIGLSSPLLGQALLSQAGASSADWYAFALGRLGYEDDYTAYLAVIRDYVQEKYKSADKLDAQKATEWHRIGLAVLSAGGDAASVGEDLSGSSINLVADGVYNRGNAASLGAQGINGWIWGLILLDALRYEVPEGSYYTRDDIIQEILSAQLADGGFALASGAADADITAMAVCALAPYYNSEQTYKLESQSGASKATVRTAVDKALACLSALQQKDGDYISYGAANAESTAQVLVALCSLGIDPLNDARFIKNGNTLLDGLLKYQMSDGGFTHSFTNDEENPDALAGESNSMAGEQALYALAALCRQNSGLRSLYDMREEMDASLKQQIQALNTEISQLPENPAQADSGKVSALFSAYLEIPPEERSYVSLYYRLSDAMAALSIENTSEPLAAYMGQNSGGSGTITDVFSQENLSSRILFNESDLEAVNALPSPLTTESYAQVTSLLGKLQTAENRADYSQTEALLLQKKQEIQAIQTEIEAINQEVLNKLYPFESISEQDEAAVKEILERMESLSEYDRAQVLRYEDIQKAQVQIESLKRARLIATVLGLAAMAVLLVVILRIRKKRRAKKLSDMEFYEQNETDGDD